MTPPRDWAELRRRLAAGEGPSQWRSPEEAEASDSFVAALGDEFPAGAAAPVLDRRRFLELAAASLALGSLAACGQPPEDIVANVTDPATRDRVAARRFATALPIEGCATGVLVKHVLGRPVKVDGNPDHPASLGATSALIEASILDLYDPTRSRSIFSRGRIRTEGELFSALRERSAHAAAKRGAGLRILTGAIASPTVQSAMARLQRRFPDMRWHQWEPLHRANAHEGARLAFGRPLDPVLRVDRADVILAIESDLLSAAPGHLAYARAFGARRAPGDGQMMRLYAIEASPTLTGANADHRFVVAPGDIGRAMRALAAALSAAPEAWRGLAGEGWIAPLAKDLAANRGRALVHVGPEQPADIHALGYLINDALGAIGRTVELIDPVLTPDSHERSLGELAAEIERGGVETLLVLGANPAYTAPGDLAFADAMKRVPFTLALTSHADESAAQSLWQVPEAHAFESWGDARAFDGTAAIIQPQVRPLHGGRTVLDLLGALEGGASTDPLAMLREEWRARGLADDGAWTEALRTGTVPNTASQPVSGVSVVRTAASSLPPTESTAPIVLLFRPDPFLRDGRLAANGWLQELPRPLTRLTWHNAALIAPATAEGLGLHDGEVVRVEVAGKTAEAPVWVVPGHAPGCVTLPLGFGRRAGAGVGIDLGFDANALRSAAQPWAAPGARLAKTGRQRALATVQHHHTMAGRDIVRVVTSDELAALHAPPAAARREPSLYPEIDYSRAPAWGMVVDLNACIGCGACTAACQAENNVPVVGEEEVLRGRQMHWLRVDRYWSGALDNPAALFQPVLCMHCEKAPCEVVCPVQATVHDSMGLNVMVYNRCVGTRFCSNNCPYKVRRFNYFDYSGREERPAEARNPDVTVRSRGVMEKCTYCLQRITEARIAADREGRPVRDGEVVTACQAACPTRAFSFGDLNDAESQVRRAKADPRGYDLLEELGTRPRTSYAARVRNPNPEVDGA